MGFFVMGAPTYTTVVQAPRRNCRGRSRRPDMRHDVAVYRAACEAHARIEAAGGRVVRIRIDAELKGQVAGQVERVRQVRGRVEAAAERRRAAAELDVPMERGKVLFPDAQIEHVTAVPTENLIRTVRVTDRADVGPANDGNVSIAAVHSVNVDEWLASFGRSSGRRAACTVFRRRPSMAVVRPRDDGSCGAGRPRAASP